MEWDITKKEVVDNLYALRAALREASNCRDRMQAIHALDLVGYTPRDMRELRRCVNQCVTACKSLGIPKPVIGWDERAIGSAMDTLDAYEQTHVIH